MWAHMVGDRRRKHTKEALVHLERLTKPSRQDWGHNTQQAWEKKRDKKYKIEDLMRIEEHRQDTHNRLLPSLTKSLAQEARKRAWRA